MKKYWSLEIEGNSLIASLEEKTNNLTIANRETGEIFELPIDSLDKFIDELILIKKDLRLSNKKSNPGYGEWLKKIKEKWPRAYSKWTEIDDQKLKEIYTTEKDISNISKVVERAEGGIISRLSHLKLINEKETDDLREKYKVGAGFRSKKNNEQNT